MDVRVWYPDCAPGGDRYTGVSDTMIEPNGALLIVKEIEGDEISGDWKVISIVKSIDRGPDLPPGEKVVELRLVAMYAPGAWGLVTFD